MKLTELKNKKILILGFGREGRDTYLFLRKLFPKKVLGVGDRVESSKFKVQNSKLIEKDKNVKWHLGTGYLKAIRSYDVAIKSPGVPIHLPEVEQAYKERKITSQTEIFFDNCSATIIGVTGTKGKGTTCSLIYDILKQAGKKAHLIGNIGKPALKFIQPRSSDIFIYELSSHQLYNLKKSPHIAVLLNIWPDHLDYFKDFKEYKRAKENIVLYQKKNDFLIYNKDDKLVREIAKSSKARKIPITLSSKLTHIERSLKSHYQLKGEFNWLNLIAAVEVARIFKIPSQKIIKAIKNFQPLAHRLERVGERQGIEFYNDSAATTPQATIAAIEALGPRVQTIILGGSDKGADFKNLAKKILQSKIRNIILFPITGQKIWGQLYFLRGQKIELTPFFVKNMKEAVRIAFQKTEKGKICLLSPASASFTVFQDYQERGELFKKYAQTNK